MKLTVVIPAFKAARFIDEALSSVVNSTIDSCVVVSEDGVFDDLSLILASYPSTILITSDVNRGAAAARNLGLDHVSTEYCFFLDADDYVDESLFEGLLDVLESTGADVAFGPWAFVHDGRRSSNIKYPSSRTNEGVVAAWLKNDCYPPCCVMWRTDSLRKLGGWDSSFRHNDDAELIIRAMMTNLKLAVSHKGCGFYVQHDSNERVSRASSVVASNAADRIFTKVAAWDGHDAIQPALMAFAYEQARRAYRSGETALGHMWLNRARLLGFEGHMGTFAHRILATILGLGLKEKIASYRDRSPFLKHRHR